MCAAGVSSLPPRWADDGAPSASSLSDGDGASTLCPPAAQRPPGRPSVRRSPGCPPARRPSGSTARRGARPDVHVPCVTVAPMRAFMITPCCRGRMGTLIARDSSRARMQVEAYRSNATGHNARTKLSLPFVRWPSIALLPFLSFPAMTLTSSLDATSRLLASCADRAGSDSIRFGSEAVANL